ncbi:MAG TPA: hypothetical protein ENI81_05575 [Phycisphaerales bacterium]|nr:hypothetical protein [Phycisphaerales bacterium]
MNATRMIAGILVLCVPAGLVGGCSTSGRRSSADAAKISSRPDYLGMVRAYADTLLQKGRDSYGRVHSPLIASTLDRSSLSLPETRPPNIQGIRNGDRSTTGANVFHDQDLYQVLYALSEVTVDRHYAKAADAALTYFFKHWQSPATGRMAWGEHLSWGFKEDYVAGRGGDEGPHEFYGPWVLWDRSFKLAPQACTKFARGLWDHQIHEHSGDFSRHAKWVRHGTGINNGYPRHGGFYIATWAEAYERTKDPVFLKAIETLVDHYERTSHPDTGAIPCSTNPHRIHIMWPESNLSLATDLWDAAGKVPEKLARKMRERAFKTDRVFISLEHEFDPVGRGFVAGANVATLKRLTEGPWTDTKIWATGYGKATDAQVAMQCYLRYQQVGLPGYARLVLDAASRYLYTEPNLAITLYPGSMADAIFLMLAAYRLTGRQYYLDRADYFARQAVEIFFDDTSPLPKASSKHNHYETITGGDDLMAALLNVWAAQNLPERKLLTVYNHR